MSFVTNARDRKELAMSLETVAKEFVALCNQGKNFDVMESMYAPDIVSVEASGEEVAGKGPVIEKSRRWGAVNAIESEKVRGPFFDGANGTADRSDGQFAFPFSWAHAPLKWASRGRAFHRCAGENGRVARMRRSRMASHSGASGGISMWIARSPAASRRRRTA